jgi:hypothetical protein
MKPGDMPGSIPIRDLSGVGAIRKPGGIPPGDTCGGGLPMFIMVCAMRLRWLKAEAGNMPADDR